MLYQLTGSLRQKRTCFAQWAVLLGMVLSVAACSHTLPSHGTYDSVLPNQAVITLRLERLDNRKVGGSLQATAVNPATNTVVDLPVSDLEGEVYQDNLSLHSTNSQVPVTYLGQIKADTITLQDGNQTTVFQRVDARQHTAHLAAVQRRAAGLQDIHYRQAALTKIHTQLVAHQKELADYVQWEPKFTQDVTGIQHWYTAQLASYQRCLTSIQAAAAANVPKWRWQECAIQASVASYARQQMLQDISAVESKQTTTASSIGQAMASTPATLAAVRLQTKGLLADCPYAADVAACERLFGQANQVSMVQRVLFSSQDVMAFQNFQPTARQNLETLEGIKANDVAHLQALATKIAAVYSNAN